MIIIIYIFGISAVAMIAIIVLDIFLITALKDMFPADFIEAGSPSIYISDFRSYSFMKYILRKKYQHLPDANLVKMFHLSRILWIIFLTGWIIFMVFISIGAISEIYL